MRLEERISIKGKDPKIAERLIEIRNYDMEIARAKVITTFVSTE